MGCSRGKNTKALRRRRKREEVGRRLIRLKVKKLQRIVPGGHGLEPDTLLLKTADYISFLLLQIDVLQTLSMQFHHVP